MHISSQSLIDEVRSRVSLASLVARDTKLERRGRLHVACCPFHAEKTPSFTLYPDQHFHCFGCQAHGDAFDYVMRRDGLDFRAAVAALATEAGIAVPNGVSSTETPEQRAARLQRLAQQQAEQQRVLGVQTTAEVAEDSDKARALIAETIDWRETPANRYWRVTRGIPQGVADRSAVLRWHEPRRGLLAVATDPAGEQIAGQLIRLRRDGTPVTRRNGKKIKLTIGRPTATSAVVRLTGDASLPLLIGEGVENTDSVAAVVGAEAWAALGQITRLEPPIGREVVALSDGDAPDHPAAIALEAWAAKWRNLGRRVVIARASPEWTGKKLDFNDLLRIAGRRRGARCL
jgi:hypothetical protein